jgi:hypothetical protein
MKKTLIFITGLGCGAVLTYLFEPVKGNRRRMSVRNKAARWRGDAGNVIDSSVSSVGLYTQLIADESVSLTSGTHPATEVTDENFVDHNSPYRLNGSNQLTGYARTIPPLTGEDRSCESRGGASNKSGTLNSDSLSLE